MKQLDLPMSNSLFGLHGEALRLRGERMTLIASNIANAATPGYKARDIDFRSALAAREGGASIEASRSAAIQFRAPIMASLDGNTVEMSTEQMAFSENAVAYATTLEFLKGRIETTTRAIRGE